MDAQQARTAPEQPQAGSRLYLAVLFSDLTDSTRLGASMEAEDYAEMLRAVRALCHAIITKHGGLIARLQGDGVLAIFGHPAAQEDDGRRATEAALELHAAVARLAPVTPAMTGRLSMHSGIHAGLVFVSEGDLERGRFELLGTVPNVAARLSDLAPAGEVFVSEETLGPQAHCFEVAERQLLRVQGYPTPLGVLRVTGRTPVERRFEASLLRGSAAFVGREAERQVLREALRELVSGGRGCIVVSGGPGLGKTRLLEELLREAANDNCKVLSGYCEGYLGAQPLQPFVQIVRRLEAGWDAAPPEPTDIPDAESPVGAPAAAKLAPSIPLAVRAALRALNPGASGATQGATSPVRALRDLLDALAAHRPVLVVLDDWQWADTISQQALDAILALQRPILVVIATRETGGDDGVPAEATRVQLAPLDDQESARTVANLLPGADPFVVSAIHQYAGGNPLFIEELCHAARADGTAKLLDEHRFGTAWLSGLIESRVARLPFEQAEVVRAAAVIGAVFPAWLLQRITGHGEDDAIVAALAQEDFVFPAERPGMLRFKHAITREVVYLAVGRNQREAMHRRIAAALADASDKTSLDDAMELLAYHYAAGGMPREAARYAVLAGDKALAAFALDRARVQFSAALAGLDKLPMFSAEDRLAWCAVAQKLGVACVFDPLALPEALELFQRAVERARQSGSDEALARAEYWLAYINYAKGRSREALAHCEEALALCARLGDERLGAQVRATQGQALATAGRYPEAIACLDQSIASKAARAKPGGSVAVGSAYALACKGTVLGDQGRFMEAEACFEEALELLGGTVHQVVSSVRNWISAVYQWQGRWQEAVDMAATSMRVAEHVKSRQLIAMARALWGHATWRATGREEGLHAVREATAWIEARQGGLVTSLNYGWLVDGAVELGERAEARRHAARLFMRVRNDDRLGEAMGCRALAREAATRGDRVRAERYLDRAMRSAHLRGSPHEEAVTRLCRAAIYIEQDRAAESRPLLDEASAAFASMRMSWHLERAHELRARL